MFDAAFGAGTAANAARAVVDAALDNWSRVVVNFNHAAGIGPPDFSINIVMNPGNNGCGASANSTIGADGKPVGGNMTINFCDVDPDDSGPLMPDGVSDWFLDPTPWEDSEFQGTIVNAYSGDAQAGSPALGRGDLLTVVTHEIGHAMGIAAGNLMSGGFVTDTGIADDAEGGGVGTFWVFQGPSVNVLLTSFDSGNGGQDFEAPIHSAANRGGAANNSLSFGGLTLYGAQEHMNAFYEFSRRYLLSNKIALMVKDAFDLDIIEPEIYGTFYATLNETTGELLVRGGNDNVQIDGVNQGASADTIVITRDGDRVVVSVDAGVDVPGTGNGKNASDQQDAFVSAFDRGRVRSIRVLAGDGNDSVTIGEGLGVPITVNGEEGNDTLIGGDVTIFGGPGNDYIVGSVGPDSLDGGSGNDTLLGFEGNDTLVGGNDDDQIFGGPGVNTVTQGADDGNDLVDLSENSVALSYTVLAGRDTVIGSPFDDTITGGPSNDRLEGRAGQDVLNGAAGFNLILGGADSDIITAGDGDTVDTVDGGTGDDVVNFRDGEGDYTVSRFVSLVVRVSRNTGSVAFLTDVEELNVGPTVNPSASTYHVLDQSDTSLRVINIAAFRSPGAVGFGRAAAVTLEGTASDDNIDVASRSLGLVAVMPWGLVQAANRPTTLSVLGLEGDDNIKVGDLGTTAVSLEGGAGDDFLSADATLNGGAGDDFLLGGAGADVINGGAGEDTMVGLGGADTIDGGADFDTILIRGTAGNDLIVANQTADTTLVYTVNGVTETDTLVTVAGVRTVERALIEAGDGDDVITVTWQDALGVDAQTNSLRFEVVGGADYTRDRLGVIDAGTGDLVLYRIGESGDTGSMTVGPANAEPLEAVFQGIEYAEPVLGAGGQAVVFKHDPFEFNNSQFLATHLGADHAINLDPTIDPSANPAAGLPADVDFYRFEALVTGTLDLQVFFDEIPTVPSGRPGLPGNGNLNIELFDRDGTLIAGAGPAFGGNDGGGVNPELNLDGDAPSEDERIRIPAVQGQVYYLRVFGASSQAVNNYSVTVINLAAPAPFDVELDDFPPVVPASPGDACPAIIAGGASNNSDTGRSQFDNVTCDSTPTIRFRLNDAIFLHDLPGNSSNDSPPDEVIPIPFQAAAGAAGYRVAIFEEGTPQQPGGLPQVPVGFATQLAEGVYEFTFPTALTDGSHFIWARVQMVDPATPQQTGFGANSLSLEIVVDTVDPNASFGDASTANDDGLAGSSDSGVIGQPVLFTDNITNDTTPAFWGTAEANAVIRVSATNGAGALVQICETIAVPTDGTNQFPNGEWTCTSNVDLNDPSLGFPEDGVRVMSITAEDLAGNISERVSIEIFLDTRGPQVTGVFYDPVNGALPLVNVFDPKPTAGPTPLTASIVINVRDLPIRATGSGAIPGGPFQHFALNQTLANQLGNYRLIGDQNGPIEIQSAVFTPDPFNPANPATGTVTLTFATPLPDDRYTLTMYDRIKDDAGNRLDGESNTLEPTDTPLFPSGDEDPGQSFEARFTVDSRPEVGTFCCGSWYIDLNGNGSFDDPNNHDTDYTNGDIVYKFGLPGDFPVVGDWDGNGFDEIGVYGRRGVDALHPVIGFYFELDLNGNGAFDPGPGGDTVFPFNASGPGSGGRPVAGAWIPGQGPEDHVAVFNGSTWFVDFSNVPYAGGPIAVAQVPIVTAARGRPIAADFDADGDDDVGLYRNNVFTLDIVGDIDFQVETSITFGFSTVLQVPVAGDWDADRDGNLGLWVPERNGQFPREAAEWYLDLGVPYTGPLGPTLSALFGGPGGSLVPNPGDGLFQPPPTGGLLAQPNLPAVFQDIFYQFGDELAEPIVGNFDPPAGGAAAVGITRPLVRLDDANTLTSAATPIMVWDSEGETSESAAIERAGDRDVFMFTPTESGRIAVDARNARSLLDTELVVYSATRRRLARNTNYGATTDSHVELNVTAGQTYYLAVSGSHRSVGAYDLTVDYLSVVAAGDTSSRLQVPSRTEGRFDTPTEVDSYVFTPTVAGRLGIKVGALSGGVQTTVKIFDAGGTVLAKSSNDPLTKVSFLNYEVTAGQQYEIRILNKSRKIGDYALEVDYLLGGAV